MLQRNATCAGLQCKYSTTGKIIACTNCSDEDFQPDCKGPQSTFGLCYLYGLFEERSILIIQTLLYMGKYRV